MIIPASTYRIQLSPEFTFKELKEILSYLEKLGVTTLYSAPFFQARKGSSHGYDIIDPYHINKEIGSLDEFREISSILRSRGMSWLQDIVPNHMAFNGKNKWLEEIFELGPESPCCHHFDIDWKDKKVLAPFLGNSLEKVIQDNELQVERKPSGFEVRYFDNFFPLSKKSYALILGGIQPWTEKIDHFQGKPDQWRQLKQDFYKAVQSDPDLEARIESNLSTLNNSSDAMKDLLDQQYFKLVHWKITEQKINYRRFFTINHLICLRMEDPRVFHSYHSFIEELVQEDLVQGLRVDHIDGLSDPLQYLRRLRTMVGPDFYLIIEKILEWDEDLPSHWPVEGTSGYSFLAQINQLTTDENAEEDFTRFYEKINPSNSKYEQLVYEQKLFILKERMGGEFHNLWTLAKSYKLIPKENQTKAYQTALGAILAAFPVYRIYPEGFPLNKIQAHRVHQAMEKASKYAPRLLAELHFWKDIFMGEAGKNKEEMLSFLQRCQQFTGPLAAKGVEDTSFYIFNRLISHNEVGDSPQNFGLTIDGYHARMKQRKKEFPLSVNATATHDTKRGEDARMRINVLSELPEEWLKKVQEWNGISQSIRGNEIPDDNEAYFIYQMLIGHFPFELEVQQNFLERSRNYLEKVSREAKVHSSWANPDTDYEDSLFNFLRKLLQNERFLSSFLPFQKKIMPYGVLKSISQSVIKSTSPGIPDIYQGTELWDLSYVDPDNRRPVDYKLREQLLSEIKSIPDLNVLEELKKFKAQYASGKIKLYCLHKVLELRKELQTVFDKGAYLPLKVRESYNEQIMAYARVEEDQYIVIVVPVLVSGIFTEGLSLAKDHLDAAVLNLPAYFPRKWTNIFTNQVIKDQEIWSTHDLFQHFPVSVLKSTD